jgi:hypothetical protein
MAAGLCYTSGTTGNPKGVLYSHRSNVLHALAQCLAISMGLRTEDRVLPVVPMFHANAWGLPYSSTLVGADLVMPGPYLQAEPLADLIASERVTVAGAVPTIWMDLLRYADEHRPDLSSLRIVACGGSAVPLSLMQAFEERHGVPIVQAWGMTETSPLGSVAFPPPGAEGEDHWRHRATAGRPLPLVEARVVGGDGEPQPWDGSATGELEVRGPWICAEYYRDPPVRRSSTTAGCARAMSRPSTPRGYIRISDRAKDVIKSGGEWISSVDLEGELMAHPAVAEAAVIAKPDDRWSERPLACVVVLEGTEAPSAEELAAHLRERVAKWWIPDEFAFIDEVPKTSVGQVRQEGPAPRAGEGRLEDRRVLVEAPRPAAAPPGSEAQVADAELVEADVVGELVADGDRHLLAQQLRVVAEVAAQRVAVDDDPVGHVVAGGAVAVVEPVGTAPPAAVGDHDGHVVVLDQHAQQVGEVVERVAHELLEVVVVVGVEVEELGLFRLGRRPLAGQPLRASHDELEVLLGRRLAVVGEPQPDRDRATEHHCRDEAHDGERLEDAERAAGAEAVHDDDRRQPGAQRHRRGQEDAPDRWHRGQPRIARAITTRWISFVPS